MPIDFFPGMPIRPGPAAVAESIRNFFDRVQFTEPAVCAALGLDSIGQIGRMPWDKFSAAAADGLDFCSRIFLKGDALDKTTAMAVCGAEVFEAFSRAGLLRPVVGMPQKIVSPVWLYPLKGFWIASDRTTDPDGGKFTAAEDVVFPAIYSGTLRFLDLLPENPEEAAVDLCGGTGIGALLLGRTCRQSATADLAVRSAAFAQFNAWLNALSVESLCGDLYEPVTGRQFDLITAHPPFVPAVGSNMVYRDGGVTGEEITQRLIAGLPEHLRPGGTAVVLGVARDEVDHPYEMRALQWLGSQASEFDVVFGLEKILTVEEVVKSLRGRGQQVEDAAIRRLREELESRKTRQFVYGALFLRRYHQRLPRRPVRMGLTEHGRAADFNRVLEWREFSRRENFFAWLAAARPRLSKGLQLTIRHAVVDGQLIPVEFLFSQVSGFETALRPDGWVTPLLARLIGEQTVAEVFSSAAKADELPADFKLEDFLGLVSLAIERGFLTLAAGHKVNESI